jgi:hypothetical protein
MPYSYLSVLVQTNRLNEYLKKENEDDDEAVGL